MSFYHSNIEKETYNIIKYESSVSYFRDGLKFILYFLYYRWTPADIGHCDVKVGIYTDLIFTNQHPFQ